MVARPLNDEQQRRRFQQVLPVVLPIPRWHRARFPITQIAGDAEWQHNPAVSHHAYPQSDFGRTGRTNRRAIWIACGFIQAAASCVTLLAQEADPGDPPPGATGNADNVRFIGGRDPGGNPVRLAKRTGHVSNYDESKVPEFSLPDPLTTADGQSVTDAGQWSARRAEILDFYRDQIYGRVPANAPGVEWRVAEVQENVRPAAPVTKLVKGTVGESTGVELNLTLHLPGETTDPVPVLLHVSFFSGDAPRRRGEDDGEVAFDPVAEVLGKGWAYAQIGHNEIQPDRPDQWQQGVVGQALAAGQERPDDGEWGTISAWAWGASRVVDYLVNDPSVDPQRIAITGTSRLGKTALWAAAQDERIASVFSVVPGEMGASLIRRDWGETLDDMAQNFHWQFAGNLQSWVGRWNELPVDQHMLIALIAPRPVYVNGGVSDQWSDPKGEFEAMVAAGPVYRLLGAGDLGTESLPGLGTSPPSERTWHSTTTPRGTVPCPRTGTSSSSSPSGITSRSEPGPRETGGDFGAS